MIDRHSEPALRRHRQMCIREKSSSDGSCRLILLNESVSAKESSDCMYEHMSPNPCISASYAGESKDAMQ